MKNFKFNSIFSIFLLLCAFLMLSILTPMQYASAKPFEKSPLHQKPSFEKRRILTFAGDYWCPYHCYPDQNPGFIIEMLQKAFYIYGIEIQYSMMSSEEAKQALNNGKADIIAIVGKNHDTSNIATHTIPIFYSNVAAFTRTKYNWSYDGIDSFKHHKLGIITDHPMPDHIFGYVMNNFHLATDAFSIESSKDGFIKIVADLLDSDIDIFVEDELVVEQFLKKKNLNNYIKNAGRVVKDKIPVYVGFSKKIPSVESYIVFLKEGISSIKATGEYDDLLRKYNML